MVIDFDCRDGCKSPIKEILIKDQDTRIIETKHGFHLYYRINGKLMKKKQTKNVSFTRNKFYDKSETIYPDLLTGIDFLGAGQLVIGEGSKINGWEYKAINNLPIKTITNAEANKIKTKLLIKNPKSLRRGFSEIFRGNIDPNKYCEQTGEEEFKYWKWMYIEAWVIGGVSPEKLFEGLERTNKGFNQTVAESQVNTPTNDPRTYDKVLSNVIYNGMFPNIKKHKKSQIKRRKFEDILEEIKGDENWNNKQLFNEAIESSLAIDTLTWGMRKTQLTNASRKSINKTDLEKARSEMRRNDKPYIMIVDEIKNEFDVITMSDSKELLIRSGNIYKRDTMGRIELVISKKVREYNLNHRSAKADVLSMLKDETTYDRNNLCYDDDKINFQNGYYDLNKGFSPTDDSLIFPFEIPHNWEDIKRDEYCPKYKEALNKWLGEESVFIADDMFEMIGYLMTTDISLKKAFMIYGQQDSGKTQNLMIINHIIGEENIARIELQRLDSNEFGTDGLEFRLVCEDDDLPKDKLKGASKFKKITGGMRQIGAEKKGGAKYKFINTVRFVFNTNNIPLAYDEGDEAFFIRWVLANFYEPIPDEDQIPNFHKTITNDPEEVQGIIHEAIEGVKRLKKRGQFRKRVIEDTREVWRSISNPLYSFIKNNCKRGPSEYVECNAFLVEYNAIRMENTREPISIRILYKEMANLGFYKKRERKGTEDIMIFENVSIVDIDAFFT